MESTSVGNWKFKLGYSHQESVVNRLWGLKYGTLLTDPGVGTLGLQLVVLF